MSAASSTTDVHSQDHISSDDSSFGEISPDEDALVEEPKIFQNLPNRHSVREIRLIEIDSDTSDTDVASNSNSSSEDGYLTPDSNHEVGLRLDQNNNDSDRNTVGVTLNVAPANNLYDGDKAAAAVNNLDAPSTSHGDLFEDVGHVVTLLKSRGHEADLDLNVVYEKLENVQHSNDRVSVVADEIQQQDGTPDVIVLNPSDIGNTVASPVTVVTEVPTAPVVVGPEIELIRSVCPSASIAEITRLLDTYDGHPNRFDVVTDHLLTQSAVLNDNLIVDIVPPPVIDMPDVINVASDVTVMTAAHVPDVVQPASGNNSTETKDSSSTSIVDPQPSTSALSTDVVPTLEGNNMEGDNWTLLKEMLPDADPDYLLAIVDQCRGNVEELMKQVNTCMELKNYPKLTEAIQRQEQHAMKRKYLERNFTVEEFLQLYDDPVTYFYNTERSVSDVYKQSVIAQLSNDFGLVYKDDLQRILLRHNYHLTPAYRELQGTFGGSNEPSGKRRKCVNQRCKKKASPHQPLPTAFDEMFYKELVFLELEEAIKDHRCINEIERNLKLESAKINNEICTCGCCYDDELLLEEMLTCSDGHTFCKECIRRSSEENIGQGKLKFPCLTGDCTSDIPLQTLQEALKPAIFSNLLRRLQEEEIKLAAIDDLVSCPFCSFSAIMSNPEDKVFKCLNPECLKESCRLCREPSHIPLRCEEVEKSDEVKMRTYIEDKMTESLLRTCPRCKRRFIKLDGCNKMTCQCGQIMCYVCRQPIKDYSHFGDGRCPQFSDDHQLHVLEVQRGAEKAKQELLQDHPELDQLHLKHDPTKDLAAGTQHVPGARNQGAAVPVLENNRVVFRQHQHLVGGFRYMLNAQWVGMPALPQIPPIPPIPPIPQVFYEFPRPRQSVRAAPPPPTVVGPPNPAGQQQHHNRYVANIVDTLTKAEIKHDLAVRHANVLRRATLLRQLGQTAVQKPVVAGSDSITQLNMGQPVAGANHAALPNAAPTDPIADLLRRACESLFPTQLNDTPIPLTGQPFEADDQQLAKKKASNWQAVASGSVGVAGRKIGRTRNRKPYKHSGAATTQINLPPLPHKPTAFIIPLATTSNATHLIESPSNATVNSAAEQRGMPNALKRSATCQGLGRCTSTSSFYASQPRDLKIITPVSSSVNSSASLQTTSTRGKGSSSGTAKPNSNANHDARAANLSSGTKVVFTNSSRPISAVVMPSKLDSFSGAGYEMAAPVAKNSYVRQTVMLGPSSNLCSASSAANFKNLASVVANSAAAGSIPRPTTASTAGSQVCHDIRSSSTTLETSRRLSKGINVATSILRPSNLGRCNVSNSTTAKNVVMTSAIGAPRLSPSVLNPTNVAQFQSSQNPGTSFHLPTNFPANLVGQTGPPNRGLTPDSSFTARFLNSQTNSYSINQVPVSSNNRVIIQQIPTRMSAPTETLETSPAPGATPPFDMGN